ncbi:hypothetical protein [Aeromonas caviae]
MFYYSLQTLHCGFFSIMAIGKTNFAMSCQVCDRMFGCITLLQLINNGVTEPIGGRSLPRHKSQFPQVAGEAALEIFGPFAKLSISIEK